MNDIILPLCICVVLPIAVVLITSLTKINADNKRSQVIIKAIDANKDIDADKLAESLKNTQKTPREILNRRLQRGTMYSIIGVMLLIVGGINGAIGSSIDDDGVAIPLIAGGIAIAIGLSNLITYRVSSKQPVED